jgi:hypothetical protein
VAPPALGKNEPLVSIHDLVEGEPAITPGVGYYPKARFARGRELSPRRHPAATRGRARAWDSHPMNDWSVILLLFARVHDRVMGCLGWTVGLTIAVLEFATRPYYNFVPACRIVFYKWRLSRIAKRHGLRPQELMSLVTPDAHN